MFHVFVHFFPVLHLEKTFYSVHVFTTFTIFHNVAIFLTFVPFYTRLPFLSFLLF